MPQSPPTTRQAILRSLAVIAAAVLFGVLVTTARGTQQGLEYFTAYFVEQALSVDNLFVMMLVFARFQIPRELQSRVLTWGIVGVVVMRGVMIASGTALVTTFHWLTYVLGALLLLAAVKLAREIASHGSGGPAEAGPTPGGGLAKRLLARVMPVTDELHGERFTVRKHGVRYATPLLLALVTIELADAVFALDSIPAVFGVTTDPFIAFTSNLFAVLGLRSMFYALSSALDKLQYLKHGLVGVLGLVGTKMLVAIVWPMPTWLSLALVSLILGGAVVASLIASRTSITTTTQESTNA